ncbi:MAG: hypothetical protein SNJ83_12990 [Aggregatilineales bacterium]
MRRVLLGWLLLLGLAVTSGAQGGLPTPPGFNRAVAFTLVGDALSAAEVTLPGESYMIDFNPRDASRWARTDSIGLIRFAPIGSPEGVYTFAPYHDGYGAASAAENRLFAQEVRWSPDGQQIAFVVNNPNFETIATGVWFWQPARETPTDPAYQLLRECPGACDMTNNFANLQWRANFVEWSPDGTQVLVSIDLLQEGRRALAVRPAARSTEIANSAPQPLRYDTGHWTTAGQIVAAGSNPQGQVGFGLISADGSVITFTPIMPPVAAWVQDAIQAADGRFYMFASPTGRGTPVQLIDDSGTPITDLLGSSAPRRVLWNSARTAALLETMSAEVFVVQVNGTVTDVSALVAGRVYGWAAGTPANSRALTLPPPLAQGRTLQPQLGDILIVASGTQAVYVEPADNAALAGTLQTGQELMIISEPVVIGAVTWFRVQTVTFSGWIRDTQNLAPATLEG